MRDECVLQVDASRNSLPDCPVVAPELSLKPSQQLGIPCLSHKTVRVQHISEASSQIHGR